MLNHLPALLLRSLMTLALTLALALAVVRVLGMALVLALALALALAVAVAVAVAVVLVPTMVQEGNYSDPASSVREPGDATAAVQ
jgi:hypothetical protein